MKKVLITGGAGGIGIALAKEFAAAGYCVFATYHNSIGELENEKGITPIYADVTSSGDIAALYEKVGAVDVLINNAGVSIENVFTDISEDEWDGIIDANLKSVFLCTKAFLPDMISKKQGSVINISSVYGVVGGSCEVAYSAAKAGVIGFTKALAKEVGLSGVTVNCIAPGVIDTKMNSRYSKDDMDALAAETPMARIGKPIDVAELALYLAGTTFVTGEVINCGGGFRV